ncbi:MAG: ORF6N domain-containing protein, partial [Limisphaerales bacterium]
MKPKKPIETLILSVRSQKVILDADLAELYGIPTYRFNEAFKRNRQRFPDDFAFQLTAAEFADLKSKPAISKVQDVAKQEDAANSSQIAMSSAQVPENNPNWSQFVTSSKKHRGATYRPWAFTEHGAIMAATVLNSPEAVAMSVFVVRAFMQMRGQLAANAAILKRLAE